MNDHSKLECFSQAGLSRLVMSLIKLFYRFFMNAHNKLECFSQTGQQIYKGKIIVKKKFLKPS
jgi:hypothetical protein